LKTNSNIEVPTIQIVKDHNIKPPSLFRTNEFTWVFQEIVNTYGVPSYKEVNPAVFTCVTFPFLFGIMFGDIGHGSILFLAGAFLCFFSEPLKKKPFMRGILKARYLILLMGLFSAFAGVIYNDMMAIPLFPFWGSCYNIQGGKASLIKDC